MKKNKRAFSSNPSFSFNKTNLSSNHPLDKNEMPRIKAKLTNSKLIHNIYGNYTEYHISVITDYKKWVVKKRYSEFDSLNNLLISKIPQINKLFPPKRFFKNSEKIAQERIDNFNQYLKFIFKNYNIFEFPEICDFIQMDKKIVELFIQKQKMLKREGTNIYQSLKKSLNRISFLEKINRSMGEMSDIEGTYPSNKKRNSIDKFSKENNIERNNSIQVNNYIIDYSDSSYEVEEPNSNYYYTLLKYENANKKNNTKILTDGNDNNNNNNNCNNNINNNNNSINIINDLNNSCINQNVIITGNLVIEEFLRNLSQNYKNKTEIINSFQDFLKSSENWPHFDKINIQKLFIGIRNNKTFLYEDSDGEDERTLPGLFELIGKYENNILLSFGCLDLLVKLLDSEYNPEIEIYLEIFRSMDNKDYESMKLEEIIKNNIGGETMSKNALKVLHVLFCDDDMEKLKSSLIKDKNVIKRLNKIGRAHV